MKFKDIIKLSIIGIAFTFMVSCGDSFLDTPVQGAISSELLSADQSGVNASLISVYKMLNGFTNTVGNTWGAAPSNYIFNSASDDVHKGSEPSDNADGYHEIALYQWTPGLGVLRHKFQSTYEGIRRANATIKLANQYKANGGDAAFVDKITAESKFLRAWYHFEAYKMWEHIPYMTENDTELKANDVDVLPLIIEDLNSAIASLPDTRSQVGRSDKIVARALLGKVKLFGKDFTGAKAEFDAVVNSGRFELTPCYNDNFVISTQNSKESIFAHQASVNDGDGNASNVNFLERLAAPHAGTIASHTGCCGYNNPTQDFANSFRVDDNGLPVADWNSKRVTVGTGDPVDPRLDWTMGRTGVPYLDWGKDPNVKSDGLHSDDWIRGGGWAGMYSPKKNMKLVSDEAGPGWTTNQLHAKNVEFIRYADVLLMLAECEVEIGSLERARELVNMVRKRAGNCAQGPAFKADGSGGPLAVPINDARITWATYKVSEYTAAWGNKDAARDAVRRERRLELGTEGHRIFDLRRWGILETTVNAYRAYEKNLTNIVRGVEVRIADLDAAAPIEVKHQRFPLPNTEVDLTGGVMKQNDGY